MADLCDKQIPLEPCARVSVPVCVKLPDDVYPRTARRVRECVNGVPGPIIIYTEDDSEPLDGYTADNIVPCPKVVWVGTEDGGEGGGGGGGGGETTEAPVTFEENFGDTGTANTSSEAVAPDSDGRYVRIELSIDAPGSIFVALSDPAIVGYSEIKPGGEYAPPFLITNGVYVISETESVAYRLSVGTYD